MAFKLTPRFHYTFRLVDLIYSLVKFKEAKPVYRFFNCEKIFFLNSARSGLSLLLKTFSDNTTLRVGVQPYTCYSVLEAITKSGCTPVFIDINLNYTIDINDLKNKAEEIDVLILTHTFGIPANFDAIKNILNDKIIIEDCAHAFLSKYKNRPCGTLGDASIFSIGSGKFPSIGQGGFVLINNSNFSNQFESNFNLLKKPSLFKEVKELFKNLSFSIANKPLVYKLITNPLIKKLDKKFDFLSKNLFVEEQCCKVNINNFFNNFKRFEKINEFRIQNSKHLLSEIKIIKEYEDNIINNYYLVPNIFINRDFIYDKLFKNGFESGKHFSKSIEWSTKFGYIMGSCPNSEFIANNILVLPCLSQLNKEKLQELIEIIKSN